MSDLNFNVDDVLLRNPLNLTWVSQSPACNKVILLSISRNKLDVKLILVSVKYFALTAPHSASFLICGCQSQLSTLPVMKRFCQMISADYNPYRSIISEVMWSVNIVFCPMLLVFLIFMNQFPPSGMSLKPFGPEEQACETVVQVSITLLVWSAICLDDMKSKW